MPLLTVKDWGLLLKDDIRAVAIAVILVVAGLFWWQVATLTDCRNAVRKSAPPSDPVFLKSDCPQSGPYGANSSVFLFALLSPLFPSAAAGQRDKIPEDGR